MKVYLATDHTGFELKNFLKEKLTNDGYEVEDCGAFSYDANDDYPDFIKVAAKKVSENPNDRAIIMGGSGQGENIVANKFKNVRCAVFYSASIPKEAADISGRMSDDPYEIVKLTRLHNNSNVLSLGIRFLTKDEAYRATTIFLTTETDSTERHVRRVNKISQIENE